MQKVKAFIFDIGGVVVKYTDKPVQGILSSLLNISHEKFDEEFTKIRKLLSLDEISEDEAWEIFLESIDREFEVEQIKKTYREQTIEYLTINNLIDHKVLDLIDSLKVKGYKIGALANTTCINTDIYTKLGIYKHFDSMILSNEVKMKKPDPKIFALALQKLNLSPQQVIFIDDLPHQVEAARNLGINSILYTSYENLISEINNLNIIL